MSLQPTLAPAHPFLDWPVVTDPAGWQAELVVLGIQHSEPYAHDSFPNDQSRAPDAIRARSKVFCYNTAHWDFDTGASPASGLPPRHIDIGNVGWSRADDYGDYSAAITERVRHFWRQRAQLIVLGGDHGVSNPVFDALDAVGESVHILHIDAHLDWRDEVGGIRRGYSNPLRRASENPAVSGMTQIGLRGIGSARSGELEDARAYGSRIFDAEQIHRDGMDPVLATIPENRAVYVTIDADGLDPTEMPAVRCRGLGQAAIGVLDLRGCFPETVLVLSDDEGNAMRAAKHHAVALRAVPGFLCVARFRDHFDQALGGVVRQVVLRVEL
jgi:agmatinase